MQPAQTTTADTQRAYRKLLGRLADLEEQLGAPVDLETLLSRGPLTREEIAAVCTMHGQAVVDELSVNPDMIAALYRRDIGVLDFMAHIREVTETAVRQAIRQDVLDEREKRRDDDREFATELNRGETAESMFGVAGLFR